MSDSDGLFQNIFSSLADGVLLVHSDLTVIKCNLAIEEMFRRAADSYEGQPLYQLFPDQPAVYDKVRQTLSTGISYHFVECQGLRKSDFTTFPAHLTISPFSDREGQIQGAVILVKDMTLIKELQETSRQMDHLSTIGALALGMAHEIRNPLGGIRGSAQLLLQELRAAEQREYLEVVISEVDRINRMVEQMMTLSRPDDLHIQKINIHKVLEDITVLEKKNLSNKNGRLATLYDPSLPDIEADEDRLKQVFLNLVKNSIEALDDGGEIRLITRVSSSYSLKTPPDTTPRKHIVVEITDTGEGMTPDQLEHIFTPFFTTKKKGSGLGLPLSLKIVEHHQGKIKITSTRGTGTSVQVFLPVNRKC